MCRNWAHKGTHARMSSALICGVSFFIAMVALTEGLGWLLILGCSCTVSVSDPVTVGLGGLGETALKLEALILLVGFFIQGSFFWGSPFIWLMMYLGESSILVTDVSSLTGWVLVLLIISGPFMLYGIAEGLIFPLKSGSYQQIAKSTAVRFFLTLVGVALAGACFATYVLSRGS